MTPSDLGSAGGPPATDFLVETTNPVWLDETLRALPGVNAFVVGGPTGPFHEKDGYPVVRVFGDPSFFKFAVENQGYCKVVRQLEELA